MTMHNALFVTGTDTGVGKTLVTAALAQALCRREISVGVMKPVETGVANGQPSDATRLIQAAGVADSLTLVRPYAFRLPLAPWDAARAERRTISRSVILRAWQRLRSHHAIVLVEGAGGVHVPITRKTDMLDLMATMKRPVLVVGRSALGGINHATLTLAALQARQIPVAALVLNRPAPVTTPLARRQERSTVQFLRTTAGVPVVGPLPYLAELESDWSRSLVRISRHPEIQKLLRLIGVR